MIDPFKKILIALNFIFGLWFSFVFLFVAKIDPISWIIITPVSAIQLLTSLALLFDRRLLANFCGMILLFLGIGGVLTFGINIVQLNHILIIITAGYIIAYALANGGTKELGIAFLISIIIFACFIKLQNNYLTSHPKFTRSLLKQR